MNTGPITQDEMIELFGEAMPIEAWQLLGAADGTKTLADLRGELRAIAAKREKNERNARVQSRYDELMAEGRHGHYETMFRVVREEVERALEQCR
jgi:hypothetical protein